MGTKENTKYKNGFSWICNIILVLLLLFSRDTFSQDLNINETVEYINNKLENCPCRSTTELNGYTKLKIGVTIDGFLTLREITHSQYETTRDFGNKYIKVKHSSLNFNRIELKKYNSQNEFIEIPCKGEPVYKPGDCIIDKNMTSGKINYWNTFKICFTADQETQTSLLNAFKHLGQLFSMDSCFQPDQNDPFLNYDQKNKASTDQKKAEINILPKEQKPSDIVLANETVYSLNRGATTNDVNQNISVQYGVTTPFPKDSYFKIKNKGGGNYYIQTVVGGQFAYGHYFKYISQEGEMYKYQRTYGDKNEFLLVNYPLSKLAKSNQFDEKIRLELINYRTSFAMLFLF